MYRPVRQPDELVEKQATDHPELNELVMFMRSLGFYGEPWLQGLLV